MSSHSLAEDDFDGFYGTDEEEQAGFLADLLFDLLSEYCPKGYCTTSELTQETARIMGSGQ